MITNYIAVGVDGSLAARAALLWAADECRVRRQMLVIVHAPDVQDALLVARGTRSTFRTLEDLGEYVLRDHAAAASERQPAVPITTRLSPEAAADALIAFSRQAELVVVGSRGYGSVVASVLGSVSDRVAAHAHCPVAIVPGSPPRPGPARVVVGVSGTHAGRLAMEFALEECRARNAVLVAVSAMRDLQDEPGPAQVLDVRALHSGTALLDELEGVASSYPDVIIEPTLSDTDPAAALLEAAADAQLVVVGCHHSEDQWSTRLGPVPTAIAHGAPCPVVVVGQRHHVRLGPGAAFATDFV